MTSQWKGPQQLPADSHEYLGSKLAGSMETRDFTSLAFKLSSTGGLVAAFREEPTDTPDGIQKNNDKDFLVKLEIPTLRERLDPVQADVEKVKQQLEPLEAQKSQLDRSARDFATYSTWAGLALLSAQLGSTTNNFALFLF